MYFYDFHLCLKGAIAQLVEHHVRNVGVVSSNLIRSTRGFIKSFLPEAETQLVR